MNRRAFLRTLTSGLATTAALGAVDPEFLLWVPGAKTIILPPAKGWIYSSDAMRRLIHAQRQYNYLQSQTMDALKQAVQNLADHIDRQGLELYEQVYGGLKRTDVLFGERTLQPRVGARVNGRDDSWLLPKTF